MTNVERIKEIMVETNRANESDKVNVTKVDLRDGSNIIYVYVEITKKRCRKPYVAYKLLVDTARDFIDFSRSDRTYFDGAVYQG